MATKPTIAVFTGSRAEYGLLFHLLRKFKNDANVSLKLIVSGTHLSKRHGNTVGEIEKDGFAIDCRIPVEIENDSDAGIAKAAAAILEETAKYFSKIHPDCLVVLGDRYEVMAAAQAALFCRIPIVHLHGGEATEGLIDEAIRHAVTKMAHLHGVAAEEYANRVIQMGEQPENVVLVGAMCIDNIREFFPLPRAETEKRVGMTFEKPFFVVTHHPSTLTRGAAEQEIAQLLSALDAFDEAHILFTGVNADMENGAIRQRVDAYVKANAKRCVMAESLGRELYYNVLSACDAVIGNSSSGLLEAPFFGVPAVNIGARQQGRLCAPSVINAPADAKSIEAAIKKALSPEFRALAAKKQSPYGSIASSPAETVAKAIKAFLKSGSLIKRFHNFPARP